MERPKQALRIKRFFSEYYPIGQKPKLVALAKANVAGISLTDSHVVVDKVEYCSIGQENKATTVASIFDLSRTREYVENSEDQAAMFANMRRNAILPSYEAWKKGHELPEHGTPLGAWAGISPLQAEQIKLAGLRTVEEIADAPDGVISKVNLPGMRDIRTQAKRFLEAASQNKVTGMLDAMKTQNETLEAKNRDLEEQLGEMKAMILAMQASQDKPKGKRKSEEEQAAA